MRGYDCIEKKKRGKELNSEEIQFLINEFTEGSLPDYQMAAFAMAVYFQGMSDKEIGELTIAMEKSGEVIDLSAVTGQKVDKHSTGGVGDKTSLVISPIVAACGVKVPMMSGRGLGHTGGTLDKLEAIPGFCVDISREHFIEIVNKVGTCIMGQTGNIVPADKKLYALRDVTATVDSIPLIASSIMSKKLAEGSDAILLDVKTGSGAFMKTPEEAIELAEKIVAIGKQAGKNVGALVTNMDTPLGYAIGNANEVIEAVDTLQGKGPQDFTDLCEILAAQMLVLAGKGKFDFCRTMVRDTIASGAAFEKFCEMAEAQGGDSGYLRDTSRFENAEYSMELKAETEGYIYQMDTEGCGLVSVMLGAGRSVKEDVIDPLAGIKLVKKTGDYVRTGEILAVLFASEQGRLSSAADKLKNCYEITEYAPEQKPLIYTYIDQNGSHTADGFQK